MMSGLAGICCLTTRDGRGTTMSERFWASGHWQVKEGKAEEFIQQWQEWLSRSSENVTGFHHARLLRALNSPRHFTSISEWETAAARDGWKPALRFRKASRRRRRFVM